MKRTKRSPDDLRLEFYEQLGFLDSSCQLFDLGKTAEAKRIAGTLRILFHHKGRQEALINQLKLQNDLTWVDTGGVVEPRNLLPQSCLTQMLIKGLGDPEYEAPLNQYMPRPILTASGGRIQRGSRIPLNEWWTNSIIRDRDWVEFSRRDLVLAIAEQDGGVHLDPLMSAAHTKLALSSALGWSFDDGSGERAVVANPILPSLRQMAFEVMESTRQQQAVIAAVCE